MFDEAPKSRRISRKRATPKCATPKSYTDIHPAMMSADEVGVEHAPVQYNTSHITPSRARQLRKVINELHKRSMEALAHYEPLPVQARYHESRARVRMIRGSNRAGKSQSAAAEICRVVTGMHPSGTFPKENGNSYVIGWDHRHIGQVMWRYLGRPGVFRLIRDEHTGKWRNWRPWEKYDWAYREKTVEAPPLLPERLIKGGANGIAWESRKEDIPKLIVMKNGWTINFASSRGAPQQGIELDYAWIDEEIENEKWYKETISRVAKFAGATTRPVRATWSATPLAATHQLYELHLKCHSVENTGQYAEFLLTIDDNPYIPQEEKDAFRSMLSPEEIQVRYYGKFALSGFKRYPEYGIEEHGVKAFPIPPNWTRYMAVDPGTTVCAVLFVAVPPSYTSSGAVNPYELHVYDELYIKRCSAQKFATEVEKKVRQHKNKGIEAFIIDSQYARQQESGYGQTIEEQYSKALEERGVRSRQTGFGFIRGSSDRDGRQEALKRLLNIRPSTGDSPLKVHRGKCDKLDWEMQNQFFKKSPSGLVTDKRKENIPDHLVDCLEYIAAYNPQWVTPQTRSSDQSKHIHEYLAQKRKKERKTRNDFISLGPGV